MAANAGDRIIVESEKVGKSPREGEIIKVIESPLGARYEVRWEDGHESTFRPSAGSSRIVSARKGRPAWASGDLTSRPPRVQLTSADEE